MSTIKSIHMDRLTVKTLLLHPIKFKAAQKKQNAMATERSDKPPEIPLMVWIVQPGDYGYNDATPVVDSLRLYGEW